MWRTRTGHQQEKLRPETDARTHARGACSQAERTRARDKTHVKELGRTTIPGAPPGNIHPHSGRLRRGTPQTPANARDYRARPGNGSSQVSVSWINAISQPKFSMSLVCHANGG